MVFIKHGNDEVCFSSLLMRFPLNDRASYKTRKVRGYWDAKTTARHDELLVRTNVKIFVS